MTRQERLKFCKACSYHKFDVNNGIVCSITNAPAVFEVACTIYKEDPELKHRMEMDGIRTQMIHESAGKGIRFVNRLIDISIIVVLLVVLGVIFIENQVLVYAVNYLFIVFYYTLFEATTGRSPAKFITGTKVVDMNGNKPDLSTILTRSFCRLVPFDIFSFLGETDKGWHDKWSKTRVVKA